MKCPKCGDTNIYFSAKDKKWKCEKCEWSQKPPLFQTSKKSAGKTSIIGGKHMKKLYGAAAKAHAKKVGRKAPKATKKAPARKATKKAAGGGVMHKAYSYKSKSGKMVHVAAHVEHPHKK